MMVVARASEKSTAYCWASTARASAFVISLVTKYVSWHVKSSEVGC